MKRYRGLTHLALGVGAGVAAAILTALLSAPDLARLVGWSTGTLVYTAAIWLSAWRLDPVQTRERAISEDLARPLLDLLVLAAGLVSITVIGLVLVAARGQQPDPARVVTGLVAIVGSWLAVHSMFWVRYARRYYTDAAGGIDFNEGARAQPQYSDFAYLTFTVAMTFQVSDSNITSSPMRRAVLAHAFTSFVFVAIILAVVINLVAGLA